MRRVVLALVTTGLGLVLLLSYKTPSSTLPAPAAHAEKAGPAPAGGKRATAGGPTTKARQVSGPVAQTEYGPVQVQATLSADGRIVRAHALRYPQDGHSEEISQQSLPRLDRAAVDAQSADIDTVSGATSTSEGYKQSLQAALDRARG
jgi:hypothetical protein